MKMLSVVFSFLLLLSQVGVAKSSEITLKNGDIIVFLGDSITYGHKNRKTTFDPTGYVTQVGNSIKAAHPDWDVKVINAGVSGNKVTDLQKRLQTSVLDKKPTIVFIYVGINDVWHWTMGKIIKAGGKGTTKEEFEAGLKDVIGRTKATGAQVVLATPSTIGEKTDGSNPQDKMLDEYSNISRKVAADEKVPLVDMRKAFLNYLKSHNPENKGKGILTVDGVHPQLEGDKLIATEMLKVLGIPLVEPSVVPPEKK